MVVTDPASINTINTLMLIGFSLLSSTLTGILRQVHWPVWGNDLITFLIAVLCMLLYVWVDSILTGTASLLFGSIAGVAVVVMSRFDPLQKWTNYLQGAVKLFGAPTTLPPTIRAFPPSALILPASLTAAPLATSETGVYAQPTAPNAIIVTRGNTPAPQSRSNDAGTVLPSPITLPIIPPSQLPPSSLDGQ
jgi:xanthine/uracil permease